MKVPAKAPPASHVDQLRAPFVPFTGLAAPDDEAMSAVHSVLTGPLYQQLEDWELNVVCRAPFAKLPPNEQLPAIGPAVPKPVIKPLPPDVPVIAKATFMDG